MRRHYYRWRERVLARIQVAALRRLERRTDFLSWRVERHLVDRHQHRISDLSASFDRLELAVAELIRAAENSRPRQPRNGDTQ